MVQHPEHAAVDRNERNHDHLKRDDHGEQHQRIQDFIDLPVPSHKDIGAHGREQNDESHRGTGHDKGVPEHMQKVHLLKSFCIVVQGEASFSSPGQGRLDDISFALKGIEYHHIKGEHEEEEDHRRNDKLYDGCDAVSRAVNFAVHYASTSFLWFRTACETAMSAATTNRITASV